MCRLPSTTATCVNGVWVVNGDIIVPENTLVDLCSGLLRIEGNLYVPRSSNVSLFRAAVSVRVSGCFLPLSRFFFARTVLPLWLVLATAKFAWEAPFQWLAG